MNIALFGGTFDPVHAGHLRAAKVACRKFGLDRILFVPTGNPPHKVGDELTPFPHRYAMVALACAEDVRFVPSLLEIRRPGRGPHYSINTTRAVIRSLRPKDQLFFLIGVDAFLDLPHWKEYRKLLDLVNFIVVSRPGFESRDVRKVVPHDLLAPGRRAIQSEAICLRHSTVHILNGVDVPVAARDIREAVRAGRQVAGLVPPLVEEYILKEGLYRSAGAEHK